MDLSAEERIIAERIDEEEGKKEEDEKKKRKEDEEKINRREEELKDEKRDEKRTEEEGKDENPKKNSRKEDEKEEKMEKKRKNDDRKIDEEEVKQTEEKEAKKRDEETKGEKKEKKLKEEIEGIQKKNRREEKEEDKEVEKTLGRREENTKTKSKTKRESEEKVEDVSEELRELRKSLTSEEEPKSKRSKAHQAKTVLVNGTIPLVGRSINSLVPNKINEVIEEPERPVPSTIKLENGCFITFQAEELANRPKNFTATFELEIEVESLEICAVRCYQDGCTGALFHSNNKSCILGYEDKHFCNSKPIISRFRHLAQVTNINPLWIHCVNCRPEVNRVTGDLDILSPLNNSTKGGEQQKIKQTAKIIENIATVLPKTSSTIINSTPQTKILPTTPSIIQKPLITKSEENGTSPALPSVPNTINNTTTSTVKPSISTSPTLTTSKTINISNISLPQILATNPNSLPPPSTLKIDKNILEREINKTTVIITEKLVNNSGKEPETIKLDNACFITFQAEPLANRPSHHKAPFELKLDVESIEVCAIRCYQDGCTGAIFNKTSNTCELSYEDKYFCSSAPIISRFAHLANLRPLNVLWIHCVNCRPEVNRKTGILDENKKRSP
ncbi:hypothetical protein ACQ4LE_005723 [Meloidogyne hapla]